MRLILTKARLMPISKAVNMIKVPEVPREQKVALELVVLMVLREATEQPPLQSPTR